MWVSVLAERLLERAAMPTRWLSICVRPQIRWSGIVMVVSEQAEQVVASFLERFSRIWQSFLAAARGHAAPAAGLCLLRRVF